MKYFLFYFYFLFFIIFTQIDGKQHPLNKMKSFAPEERQAGAPLMLTKEAAVSDY